ncbi:MAG: glycosyltransferase family 2 protein [Victivallaceae bacterium]|nr:glycosyltransferase family 2 protein [Victivallaceae bacterium]
MLSIVVPVYNEGDNILALLRGLKEKVTAEHEICVVYDFPEDTTLPALDRAEKLLDLTVRRVRNRYGKGALNAIRTGLEQANGALVLVTMADLSDPPEVIDQMVAKAQETSADLVCASRYMRGGSQSGGPRLKSFLSRTAGMSLHLLAGIPTHDATNSFKLYRKSFLDTVRIESRGGFELGLELVVKAHLNGRIIAEVPTSWQNRAAGKSRFRLWAWLPNYLKWYLLALFGRRKTIAASR